MMIVEQLDFILSRLFTSSNIYKLCFDGIHGDLKNLAISYHHQTSQYHCFQYFNSVLDIQYIAKQLGQSSNSQVYPFLIDYFSTSHNHLHNNHNNHLPISKFSASLAKLSSVLLNSNSNVETNSSHVRKVMNKEQQASKWHQRPLTAAQVSLIELIYFPFFIIDNLVVFIS
jgi:hypothetical protein